jgi:prepilin-type N-terminal cleavage/methylation domain-containing protein
MTRRKTHTTQGFTLAEVVIALAISVMVFSGIIAGYVQSSRRAEWTGYSLAAQALSIQQLEQARAAKWDVLSVPAVDEITNLPLVNWSILDLPVSGSNVVYATNFISIKTVSVATNPPEAVRMVKVSTVWPFRKGRATTYYTNTLANYYAPDR